MQLRMSKFAVYGVMLVGVLVFAVGIVFRESGSRDTADLLFSVGMALVSLAGLVERYFLRQRSSKS